MKRFVILLLATILASTVAAENLLIPINAAGLPGANGSIWVSHLAITNFTDTEALLSGIEPCTIGVCDPTALSPKSTIFTAAYRSLLWVNPDLLDRVSFQLRVQDVSRQSQTWGTSIPVVLESDAFSVGRILPLSDIPVSEAFRSMLRIYDFDPVGFGPERQVHVRYYTIDSDKRPGTGSDEMLLETTYPLLSHPTDNMTEAPRIEIPLWTIPELVEHPGLIRVEIEAVTLDLHFWGFVSATNNETQHVTVIAP